MRRGTSRAYEGIERLVEENLKCLGEHQAGAKLQYCRASR